MHKQQNKKISVFQLLLNQIKPSPAVRPPLTEERTEEMAEKRTGLKKSIIIISFALQNFQHIQSPLISSGCCLAQLRAVLTGIQSSLFSL